jgi:hypothetical protein
MPLQLVSRAVTDAPALLVHVELFDRDQAKGHPRGGYERLRAPQISDNAEQVVESEEWHDACSECLNTAGQVQGGDG